MLRQVLPGPGYSDWCPGARVKDICIPSQEPRGDRISGEQMVHRVTVQSLQIGVQPVKNRRNED